MGAASAGAGKIRKYEKAKAAGFTRRLFLIRTSLSMHGR